MSHHLTQLQRDLVTYVIQQYKQNCAWWEPQYRKDVRFRMWLLFIDIGITRRQAHKIERKATAATGGWSCQGLPQYWRNFAEEWIFN
ncbi:hypothetical protein AAVH_13714 [Aphelenchoides avenae]|nr:hypothetical protein AAVH_13714 [Aphelenchus avenae]